MTIRLVLILAVMAGSVVLVSSPGPQFADTDKAYYADPSLVNFVRPGLVIKILSAEIAGDGTIKTRVRFTDPMGLPLDKDGVTTPGRISNGSPGIIAAYIPKGQTQYVAYTTRIQTSPITGKSATQAGADAAGAAGWTKVAEGEYDFTFRTKAPTGFDRTATHTIGVYANRNLTEFEMGTQLADAVYHFVPDGSKVATTRDVIKTATCNKCHDNLHLHGETGRKSMEVCVLCHQPQTVDPDTGLTMDMAVMTHKIHAGHNLPSVEAGGKYMIIGNAQSQHDYSTVAFPSAINSCTVCHEQGKGAAQETAYLKPNRAACGSCHDNVNFATGENHVDLPQVSDSQCSTCHTVEGELEFDASIKGAHTVPTESKMLKGVVFEIVKVDNHAAGQKPIITFTLKDKKGNGLALADMNRLSFLLAGPTTDYTAFGNGYRSENALTAAVSAGNGVFTYTFTNAIPAGAKGSFAIGVEGRREEKLLEGTKKEMTVRAAGINKVTYFSVDGSRVEPRRQIVSLAKCNACHENLSLHGGNRNQIEQCVLCHNPVETDAAVRPASAMPAQTIDLRTMIHKIHSGENIGDSYAIYGRGGPIEFSEVRYPQDRRNCQACHVNNSEIPPLRETAANLTDPRGWFQPYGPVTAACLSCHTDRTAASHALVNTSTLGESCSACHAQGYEFDVRRVHAFEVR
jgi:OmcA/MtrC family decaheme c-type cytochrome